MNIGRLSQLLKYKNVFRHRINFNEKCLSINVTKNYHSSLQKRRLESEEQNNERIDAIGWLLTAMPIASFILGTWQVKRRAWKLELIDNVKQKLTLTPVPLPEDLQELEEMEYMPVKVRGEFLYDKEVRIGPKSLIQNGVAVGEKSGGLMGTTSSTGYWIITPFKLSDRDITILVNRGWIRSKRGPKSEKNLAHIPGQVEITGIVRVNESRPTFMPKNAPQSGLWTHRDLNSMAKWTGSSPVFIDLIASDGPPGGPIAGQTRVSFRNEHLSYIITWYTLSILTAIMWHRLYVKKLPLL